MRSALGFFAADDAVNSINQDVYSFIGILEPVAYLLSHLVLNSAEFLN
jgi:hypothetical protein